MSDERYQQTTIGRLQNTEGWKAMVYGYICRECGCVVANTEAHGRVCVVSDLANDGALEVVCGLALEAHYADNKWQTFHHAPSVAGVVLDSVPDGWAKVDGEWSRVTSDGVGYGEFDRDHSCPLRPVHSAGGSA